MGAPPKFTAQPVGLEKVKVANISNEMETSFRVCHIRNEKH